MNNTVNQETGVFQSPSIIKSRSHSQASKLSIIHSSKSMRPFASEEEIKQVLGKKAKVHNKCIKIQLLGGSHPNLEFHIPMKTPQKIQPNGQLYNATRGYHIPGFVDTLGKQLFAVPQVLSVRVVPGQLLSSSNSNHLLFRLDHSLKNFLLTINWVDTQGIRQHGDCPLLPVDNRQVLYSRRTTSRNDKDSPQGVYGKDFYILSMDYAPDNMNELQATQILYQRQQLLIEFFRDDSLYQPPQRIRNRGSRAPKPDPKIEIQEGALAQKVEELMAYKNEPVDYLVRFCRLEPLLEKIDGHRVSSKGAANQSYTVEIPWIRPQKKHAFSATEFGYGKYLEALAGWIDEYFAMVRRNEQRAQEILERIYKLEEAKKRY